MKRLLTFGFLLACVGVVLESARADVPLIVYTQDFSAPGTLPIILLSGQSSCSISLLVDGGSALVSPVGSSDNLTTGIIPSIGIQSTDGVYGGSTWPYYDWFQAQVDVVSGTVTVSEACSGAVGSITPLTTPSPIPTFTPTPTPSPVPTPPTPTPSPTPANCPTAIASLAPIASYPLNETSGTSVTDASGNSYTGTILNPALVALQQPALSTLPGSPDYSYSFALPGYVSLPTSIPYGGAYTLIAQVAPAIGGAYPRLCIIVYHGQCVGMTNGYLGWANGTLAVNTTHAIAVSQTAPHLVVLTEDTTVVPATVKVSVDGGTLINANLANAAAARPVSYSYLNVYRPPGSVASLEDNATILPYILTQTQVAQLAVPCAVVAPTPTPVPTPVPPGNYAAAVAALHPLAYYRLDESSGTTAADSSGNGYDGTILTPGNTTLGATSLLTSDADTAFSWSTHPGAISLPTLPSYLTRTVVFLVKATSYTARTQLPVNYWNLAFGTSGGHPAATSIAGNGTCCAVYTDTTHTLTANTSYWLAFVTNGNSPTGIYASTNGGTLVKLTGAALRKANATFLINNDTNSGVANSYTLGTVDEVVIFPYALSQAQLTALAATAGYSP